MISETAQWAFATICILAPLTWVVFAGSVRSAATRLMLVSIAGGIAGYLTTSS